MSNNTFKFIYSSTQENYATQDNSGMCHLMPRRYLPEWRERMSGHLYTGILGLNHAMTSIWVCHKAFQGIVCHFKWLYVNAVDNG